MTVHAAPIFDTACVSVRADSAVYPLNWDLTDDTPSVLVDDDGPHIIAGISRERMESRFQNNLEKLERYANFTDNWNADGAESFRPELLNLVRELITQLPIQPEIFPIPSHLIQLEWHRLDGGYLEVEVGVADKWSAYIDAGHEGEFAVRADIVALKEVVSKFYDNEL